MMEFLFYMLFCVCVCELGAIVGPVTRWSRLEKRRGETRRDGLDLVSSRDFVSRDGLELKFLSRKENTG